jgi:hypothetical protein
MARLYPAWGAPHVIDADFLANKFMSATRLSA